MTTRKELLVNAFYCASPSQSWPGLWAHPDSNDLNYNSIEYWTDLARICEDGLLDGIFMADILGVNDRFRGSADVTLQGGAFCPTNDPMMVVSAMAAVTEHLTFGITGNTTFEPPFLLARRLTTLDHLTRGRIAWNVVTGTSPSAARSLGQTDLPAYDKRYDIADEFMEVVYKLWEGSWEDGAAIRDKSRRVFADPSRVHRIQHSGENFQTDGIFLAEPSPQRTPFVFSAGGSTRGVAFGGKHAESVFLVANNAGYAKHQIEGIHKAARTNGRDPADIKIFNLATVIVADNDRMAEELVSEIGSYSNTEGNLAFLSSLIGVDLSTYAPDEPLVHVESDAIQSVVEQMTKFSDRVYTIGDLARFGPMRGPEPFFAGSPTTVCDRIEKFVEETGVDGLNQIRTVEPAGIRAFCDLVVPELQNRGLFKTEYRPGTMRQKMFPGQGPTPRDTHPSARMRPAR